MDDIRANNEIKVDALNTLLMDRYGIKMAKSTLYKMKAKAMHVINGGHDESFALLPSYCEVIKETNPGSVAHCVWTPERPPQFKSIFVSFAAQFNGVIGGCRSLIGVDGAHLKGSYGGVLLSAVALDGNNELFPIAVAVVQSENKETWAFFLYHLKNALKEARPNWTIISDRQKGVEPALDELWPEVHRRYCARYLCKNFKGHYLGPLMHQLFWRVVNAYSEYTFKKALERLVKEGGRRATRWLLDIGNKEKWCRHAFSPELASDDNTSNFVESFNATLGVHRALPILSALEGIRRVAMVRHATRQHVAEQWSDDGVCPNVVNRLQVLTKDSKTCTARPSRRGNYKVSEGNFVLPVSISEKTCACGQWQISRIPCRHAVRALLADNKEPVNYVSSWFFVLRYKAAYGLCMMPIPDHDQWQDYELPQILPPVLKRRIGRPARDRRREQGEARKGKRSSTVKCGNSGHNATTCKGGLTKKQQAELNGKVPKEKATNNDKGKTTSNNKGKATSNNKGNATNSDSGRMNDKGKGPKTRSQNKNASNESDFMSFTSLEGLEGAILGPANYSSQKSEGGRKGSKKRKASN